MPRSFTEPESFYSADEEAWWASVDKALKGASREKLFGLTDDGFEIAPLYARRTDTPARVLRAGEQDWGIIQRVDIGDPASANAQILEDLEGGANGLELLFAGAATANNHGLQIGNAESMGKLLDGVLLELINLRVEAGRGSAEALALIFAHMEMRHIEPASVKITAGFDPFGWLATHNGAALELAEASNRLKDIAAFVSELGSPARVLKADGRVWHDAGATPAQELALVLSSAAAHLRLLEGTNLAPETWADRIGISLVADADQFGTIAKARAMRALWSCVLEGAGLPQSSAELHMVTSYRMLTKRDPWVNLLRNTVAAFAAGIGGADSICILPHTLAVGLPDAFARRLARNTQSILLGESNLSKVMDPSAGSGAIENRTDSLCMAAWDLFQEIEAAGGIVKTLENGFVQGRINDARKELNEKIARRKRPITGVSEFPHLSEARVKVLPDNPKASYGGPVPQQGLPEPDGGAWFKSLRQLAMEGHALLDMTVLGGQVSGDPNAFAAGLARVAEPFENLRSAAEEIEARSDHPPAVFLASLGSLAQFTGRATWVANAFAAGGIRSVEPAIYDTTADVVAAFKKSGAELACIVSSDEVYEAAAEEVARSLKDAGAKHLYLAGRPGSSEKMYNDAGIDAFVYAGCNLLELLQDAHERFHRPRRAGQSDEEVLK